MDDVEMTMLVAQFEKEMADLMRKGWSANLQQCANGWACHLTWHGRDDPWAKERPYGPGDTMVEAFRAAAKKGLRLAGYET